MVRSRELVASLIREETVDLIHCFFPDGGAIASLAMNCSLSSPRPKGARFAALGLDRGQFMANRNISD